MTEAGQSIFLTACCGTEAAQGGSEGWPQLWEGEVGSDPHREPWAAHSLVHFPPGLQLAPTSSRHFIHSHYSLPFLLGLKAAQPT